MGEEVAVKMEVAFLAGFAASIIRHCSLTWKPWHMPTRLFWNQRWSVAYIFPVCDALLSVLGSVELSRTIAVGDMA
jgi:hypothetical protein